ncbi:MAG: SDR family NAD(P)-dependent oxidoreductase, partial [Actinomycetota bacterium]|nr:SDR family NAD(P)-dependent oxidoreductase [Actinomycetota bacterium]
MSFLDTLFDLSGKTVVVTGGSRGLGKEMALACAAAGADIVVASRKLDACKLVTDEIERVYGRAAMPYSVHIGRWD